MIVDDSAVYHTLNDFRSAEARKLYQQRIQKQKDYDNLKKNLDDKREQYAQGAKDKEELRRELLEMAILQAESELAVNPAFAGLSAAEKRKRLLQAIGSHADAMALEMLKAQFLADFQTENAELLAHKDNLTPEEEKELEKKIREFNDKVKTAACTASLRSKSIPYTITSSKKRPPTWESTICSPSKPMYSST